MSTRTSAWRELADGQRLRRPAGALEPTDELPDELLTGGELQSLDLGGSRRRPLTLVDTVLRRCDLTAALWDQVTLRQVELLDCRALGLRASLEMAQDVYVSGCRFDSATLRVERVRGLLVFTGCTFTEAVLGGDLSAVVFSDCSFDGADFAASAATGCDLRGSRLDGARGLLTLRGARVTVDQTVTMAPRLALEAGFTVED